MFPISFFKLQVMNHTSINEGLELAVDEEKINCFQIDEVVEHIRELLQQECDILLNDIDFLYQCIDDENEYRQNCEKVHLENKEPTLNELKEERRLLESDLMSSHSRNQVKISKLPETTSSARSNRSIMSPIISPTPTSAGRVSRENSKESLLANGTSQTKTDKVLLARELKPTTTKTTSTKHVRIKRNF